MCNWIELPLPISVTHNVTRSVGNLVNGLAWNAADENIKNPLFNYFGRSWTSSEVLMVPEIGVELNNYPFVFMRLFLF